MNIEPKWHNFYQEIHQPDQNINVAKAALYFAQTEYPHIQPQEYLNVLDLMANQIKPNLPPSLYPLKVIKTINQYLFQEMGFIGDNLDYYNPRNSFLNEVMERRAGIPLTLSLIYLEIAKRIGFKMVGIGMPGHFLIRPDFEDAGIFVDAFTQGEILFEEDCKTRIKEIYQQEMEFQSSFLNQVGNRQILMRMLTNLKVVYLDHKQFDKALNIVNGILLLFPNHPRELRDRGLLYYQLGQFLQAKQSFESYLNRFPNAQDRDTIVNLLNQLR
jgi:regulator of sirC expression with transglutaminase-like and TPR domain